MLKNLLVLITCFQWVVSPVYADESTRDLHPMEINLIERFDDYLHNQMTAETFAQMLVGKETDPRLSLETLQKEIIHRLEEIKTREDAQYFLLKLNELEIALNISIKSQEESDRQDRIFFRTAGVLVGIIGATLYYLRGTIGNPPQPFRLQANWLKTIFLYFASTTAGLALGEGAATMKLGNHKEAEDLRHSIDQEIKQHEIKEAY